MFLLLFIKYIKPKIKKTFQYKIKTKRIFLVLKLVKKIIKIGWGNK